MLDKMKQLMDAQKKMAEFKRQLEETVFDVRSSEGLVEFTLNGTQEIKQVNLGKSWNTVSKEELEKAIKEVYNKALKHSREVAARKMKDITGLNFLGLT